MGHDTQHERSVADGTRLAALLDLDLPPSFPIVWRGEVGYQDARVGRVFNHRRPNRFPIAVVEATMQDHLTQTVQLAKKLNCRVSVRSGGHSWAVWSVRDDAILVDLGKYYGFSYHDASGIVTVSPSCTSRMLNTFLEPKGRFFPGGHCSDAGLGGFLLQGGMGWNCKNWGWACEQIVGVDVVTADGESLHCSSTKNSDLFWAARGAGPGFPAIVSRFHLQTWPHYPCLRTSVYFYKLDDYKKALGWAIKIAPHYDPNTEILALSSYLPGSNDITILVYFLTFQNDEATAKRVLQRAEDEHPAGNVDGWFAKPTSLPCEYQDLTIMSPRGHRWCVDNAYVDNDADVVAVLEPAFTTLPTKTSYSLWFAMAPCSRRTLPDMALSMQSDHYFATYAGWEEEKDDEGCTSWVENIMAHMEPSTIGAYLGDADFQIRQPRFWGKEEGKRLMEIRKQRDPQGRICGYLDRGDTSGAHGLPNL